MNTVSFYDALYMKRLSKNKYFMNIALEVSKRATCNRAHVGCILVKDDRIIATGYNGSPPKMPHCDDENIGHDMENKRCVRTLHAELNAILQCAKHGISADRAICYCTIQPCLRCSMALFSVGIKEIKFLERYKTMTEKDEKRLTELIKSGLKIEKIR